MHRIENLTVNTFAVLYLATLLVVAITCTAVFGPIGAIAAIPFAFAAAAEFIHRLK